MKREHLTKTQQMVFDTLPKEQQTAYLVAADGGVARPSTRILAADMLPIEVLATINNGVCRAVLKIKKRERGIT